MCCHSYVSLMSEKSLYDYFIQRFMLEDSSERMYTTFDSYITAINVYSITNNKKDNFH